jgi:hypothetical protein
MLPTCLLLLFAQVFLLLVTEMLIFLALIVPLPFTWRRRLFTFISESPIIAKLQYGMKVGQPEQRILATSNEPLDHLYLHPHPLH